MWIVEGALNLTPIAKVLLVLAAVGVCLFVVFWVGFFLLHALSAVFRHLSGQGDEFGEVIVFWGGAAIVVALIVLAFTQHLVTFE